jgi:hypothetical protein
MSYEFYKIVHLTGIVLLFTGLVGLLTLKMAGAEAVGRTRKLVFVSHGIGAFLVLLGGFGLLARLQLASSIPNWAWAKIFIWVLAGAAIAVIKRKGQLGWPIFGGLMVLFVTAAWLAILKPF